MLWFFKRNTEVLRLETRYDNATAEFVLVTHPQDGDPTTERFGNEAAFQRRLKKLERQLDADSWTQHGPIFLRDGWKIG